MREVGASLVRSGGLGEAAGIGLNPVATTSMGKGVVDEGHPLSAGVVGYFMGRRAVARYNRPLIDAADVILFVGARTNQSGTDSWKLFPRDAHYIHIDMDPQEVGRNYEALRLVGDIDATLEPLVEELAKRDLRKRSAARNAVASDILRGRKAHIAKAESVVGSNAQPTRPERVMADSIGV